MIKPKEEIYLTFLSLFKKIKFSVGSTFCWHRREMMAAQTCSELSSLFGLSTFVTRGGEGAESGGSERATVESLSTPNKTWISHYSFINIKPMSKCNNYVFII